ncbi:MAG: response regulator [Bacteroidota bacterium]
MEKNNSATIFLVEDNEMFAETLSVSLRNQGFIVHSFRSGEQMISSWEYDPDIILLDYFIESPLGFAMNGEKILRFIRRITKNLPVVMLTSNSDIGEATSLLKQGAVDFIVKDDDLVPNLEKTLKQILDSVKLREEMAINTMKIKKYRKRFLIIALIVAMAAIILLLISS